MTTPAALAPALPAAPATSSSDEAASLAMVATSSRARSIPRASRAVRRTCGRRAIRASRRPCLAMDFVKANRETVERAIRDKGVDLDLDALLALDGEVRARQDRDRPRCVPSATRSARSSRTRRPKRKPSLGARRRKRARGHRRLKASLPTKEAELKALMLKLPGIPYEGAPVGPDESYNTGHPHRRRAAQVRIRAARPCRADREERLGRPQPRDTGVGQPRPIA